MYLGLTESRGTWWGMRKNQGIYFSFREQWCCETTVELL